MIDQKVIISNIQKNIPTSKVEIESEDGVHFFANIWAEEFAGKSMLEQHRMVYDAVGKAVGREIHALSIKTHVVSK
ncbi:MAG: BolA family transcriptional regulator [Legionellales bacterium]|nr:BolA family transcriptional regulator [Legionellales bacterium]